ncbi:unnamed protein product [Rotaria sp. Silwood1]|nr:unnamed protein product [Rotaria sp. Silwood1]CAF1624878.1 unnamed protein product [Rotaria sp. Silwood1]
MKRTLSEKNDILPSRNLVTLDGYIIHIGTITKNNGNDNHHYSFIICLEDQSTVRVIKHLSKFPCCSLYNRLKESLKSGQGASISSLREQNEQYTCTPSTKLIEKDLNFRPNCIRVKKIYDLKNEINDRLCTVQVKICDISEDIPVVFEENQFKRIQKMKRKVVVGDASGALEMTIWQSHFDQILLNQSYHIRLLKVRVYNDQLSLVATTDTSFIKIDELENVVNEVDSTINRSHIEKGRIISIEKNDNNYACQGCGGLNISDAGRVISCNDCNCRLYKDTNILDGCLKINILTLKHEEYNLQIPKAILIPMLHENDDSSLESDDYCNIENNLSSIISLIVQFTYDETTGTISEIGIATDNESTIKSMFKYCVSSETLTNNIVFYSDETPL